MLERKGVARFKVTAELHCDGKQTGSFVGEFVALGANFPD